MIEYTHDKYYMMWTFGIKSKCPGTDAWNFALHFLGPWRPDSKLLLKLKQDFLRQKCNTYNTCESKSPTDCKNSSFSVGIRHNCSCGRTEVENLTRDLTRNGNIANEDPQCFFVKISFILGSTHMLLPDHRPLSLSHL